MPTGPPISAANITNLPLLVLSAAHTFLRLPRSPLYKHAHSAENRSCKKVLTKGAKKTACSVLRNGVILRAMPKMTVSNAQVIPANTPKTINEQNS